MPIVKVTKVDIIGYNDKPFEYQEKEICINKYKIKYVERLEQDGHKLLKVHFGKDEPFMYLLDNEQSKFLDDFYYSKPFNTLIEKIRNDLKKVIPYMD